MPYNETEYAIVVASGMGITQGENAIKYIKENFGLEIPRSTYWRYYGKLQAQPFKELEYLTVNKVILHLQRIAYFYHLRTKINKALDEEDKPEAITRMALRAAELEKYIAQLESMSRAYFEKAVKDGQTIPQELALVAV